MHSKPVNVRKAAQAHWDSQQLESIHLSLDRMFCKSSSQLSYCRPLLVCCHHWHLCIPLSE